MAKIDPDAQWKGHTVRAVDGTYVTLPLSKSVLSKFPLRKTGEHFPKARLTCAVNVITGQPGYLDVGNIHSSERDQLEKLVYKFGDGDILLLDRGFRSSKLWEKIHRKKQYFINRITIYDGANDLAHKLLKSNKNDIAVDYKGLNIRLVRGVKRKKKAPVVLATNLLDAKKYTRKSLLKLYMRRWEVETNYKKLKQNLRLKNFHAQTYNGVMQELLACSLLLSLVQGLMWLSRPEKAQYRINFNAAMESVWQNMQLFISGHKNIDDTLRALQKLLREIRCMLVKERPGRSFPRVSYQAENKWIKIRRKRNHVQKDHWKWSDQYRH